MLLKPYIVFEAPEATPAAEAAPVVAEAAAEAVAEATPAEAPVVNPGPWAADLNEYFGENAEAIAAADRYMREKVQPRMTELETGFKPARELYDDFTAQPQETLLDIIEELYGEERAQAFEKLLSAEAAETPPAEDAETTPLPPEVQALVDQDRERKQAEQYQQFTDAIKTEYGLDDDDIALIHPHIVSASGDAEKAVASYRAYVAKFTAKHGVTPAEAEAAEAAPATLGADGTAVATPPGTAKVYKDYSQLGDAVDDFLAANSKGAPSTVGAV